MSAGNDAWAEAPAEVRESVAPVGERRAAVALFDFDGTLTLCDSLLPFLRFAAGRARFATGFAAAAPWILAWKAGLIDNAQAKRRLLGAVLAGAEEERSSRRS